MPDRLAIMLDSVIFAVDKGLSFDGIVSMPEIGLEDFGRRPGLPGWVDYLTEQFWRAKAALSSRRSCRRAHPPPRVPTPTHPSPGSSSPPLPPPPSAPPSSSPSAPELSAPLTTTSRSPGTPSLPTPSPSSPAPASPDAPPRDPRKKHDPILGDPLPRVRGPLIEEQLPRRKDGGMLSGSDADQKSRPDVGQN